MRERLKKYRLGKEISDKKRLILETEKLLINSVKELLPKKGKVGLLFSGGVDSTTIAVILQSLGVDFTCYTSGLKDSPDILWAKRTAKLHKFRLKTRIFSKAVVKKHLFNICKIIKSNNTVKVGVAIPFYFAGELAGKDKVNVLFSGLGSEELYAGYERFVGVESVNKECLKGLRSLYERDLTRDEALMKYYNISPGLPFLNHELIKLALKTPGVYKINKDYKKIIIRWVAEGLNVDKSVAWRRKKAAQYGSGSDKVLEKLAKPLTKSEYLRRVFNPDKLRLGVLYSGGKDSNLALHRALLEGHDIKCLISMLPVNPASYMFHPSDKRIIMLQSKALKIPAVIGCTLGEKEKELKDLKKLIMCAKMKYALDGIVTGALFSEYQRKRIADICSGLKLECFNPLWHMNQSDELKELLKKGFKFIMTSVAGMGLDKTWLNRAITEKEVNRLNELDKKHGLNVAGEGGEYESLVLDAPMFRKKLVISKSRVVEEDENTALLLIDEVSLVSK